MVYDTLIFQNMESEGAKKKSYFENQLFLAMHIKFDMSSWT